MSADREEDFIAIDLEDIERELLSIAINEFGLTAKRAKPLLIPLLGLINDEEWYALLSRLIDSIDKREPLTDHDWARALFLTELSFGSELVGAGLHFAPALDAEWLEVLRSVQRKVSNAGRFTLLLNNSRFPAPPAPSN